MKRNVGLWIDHKKAVIFSLTDQGAELKRISSEPGKDRPISGRALSKSGGGHANKVATDLPEGYYDEVLSHTQDAESLLIFGPGEAKSVLKRRLEKNDFRGQIVGFESAVPMSDNEIVTKVRHRFLK